MTTRQQVREFLAERRLALVGASRRGNKFGNTVLKELTAKGYEVLPVHPEVDVVDGVRCCRQLSELPGDVSALIVVVPPSETERVVEEAASMGLKRVWLQQGAESPGAIDSCRRHGIDVVHGECILMFAEPAGFVHRAHGWLWRVLGKLPEEQ
jgi:predicted CoA-binding protein